LKRGHFGRGAVLGTPVAGAIFPSLLTTLALAQKQGWDHALLSTGAGGRRSLFPARGNAVGVEAALGPRAGAGAGAGTVAERERETRRVAERERETRPVAERERETRRGIIIVLYYCIIVLLYFFLLYCTCPVAREQGGLFSGYYQYQFRRLVT
jgi:hypothetical protein